MGGRILVVEDSSIMALDLKKTLERIGYQVPITLSSGEEAINLLKKENFSLVLMDIQLAGELDGIEAASLIKKDQDIPIIFITAFSDNDTFTRAKMTEPSGFISKPYSQEVLQRTIELALFQRQIELQLKERERRLKTLISNLQGMVFRCLNDEYFTMEFVSQGCYPLTGFKEEQLLHQEVSFLEIIHPEDRMMVRETIDKALQEKRHFTLNYRIITAQGEEKWVWKKGIGVFDGHDEEMIIEGFVTDITSQKEIEKRLSVNKKKIESLHWVAIQLENCQGEEEVYQLAVRAAEEILNFTICCLDMIQGNRLVVKAVSSGSPPDGYSDSPLDEGLAGKTVMTGQSFLIGDLGTAEGAKPVLSQYKSAISVPIGDMGVFQVISVEKNAFDEEDLNLVELLISHTTAAIKRIRSAQEIKYISFHDKLTGLYNRFFFEEEMKRLNTERNLPLSIIIGDVNGLKLVNDAFDHQQGDILLKDIAKVMRQVCRKEDIICRWGGDEYAVFLTNTGTNEATTISHRILEACDQEKRRPVPLSISLGCATKTHMEQSLKDVLKRAEENMYKHKLQEGRRARDSIICNLQQDLAKKSQENREHICCVQKIARKMGEELGFSTRKLEELVLLASIHDMGMISIDEGILTKSSCLDLKELQEIQKHPEIGFRIALTCSNLAPLADAILAHHEHWNGKGYPQGLKGEEIPFLARIIGLADSFTVMIQGTCYREPLSVNEALLELKRGSGTQFDPKLLNCFLQVFSSYHCSQ